MAFFSKTCIGVLFLEKYSISFCRDGVKLFFAFSRFSDILFRVFVYFFSRHFAFHPPPSAAAAEAWFPLEFPATESKLIPKHAMSSPDTNLGFCLKKAPSPVKNKRRHQSLSCLGAPCLFNH